MKLAESLPKIIAEEEGGLLFCSVKEGVGMFLERHSSGRPLFVVDTSALHVFESMPSVRYTCVVLDTADALPLFSTSDDCGCILAAGGKDVMTAARFYAEVHKIPVALFPTDATLSGALEKSGSVTLRKARNAPFRQGSVFCDLKFLQGSLGRAYARLLLSMLALIEADALRSFGIRVGDRQTEERAFRELIGLCLASPTAREVIEKNAMLRRYEDAGLYRGEGTELAARMASDGEWRAYLQLSALYSAFFRYGKPRLYTPDYAMRAKRAGVSYFEQRIPTVRQYACRAVVLEKKRARYLSRINSVTGGDGLYKRTLFALTGRAACGAGGLNELCRLPERVRGLCSIIRDFGLMDFPMP